MSDRRAIPNGFDPSNNQSEYFAPITSIDGDTYGRNGVPLSRGFQTYLPGPFHFEDCFGQIGTAGYMPAPIYNISMGFQGDVSLKEAPKWTPAAPWRRGAIY